MSNEREDKQERMFIEAFRREYVAVDENKNLKHHGTEQIALAAFRAWKSSPSSSCFCPRYPVCGCVDVCSPAPAAPIQQGTPKEDYPVSMTMEKYHEFLGYEAECKLRDARSASAEPVAWRSKHPHGYWVYFEEYPRYEQGPHEPLYPAPVSSTTTSEAASLAEQWKGRADDCGRLARAVLDAPRSATEASKP
jgi:hypothetical protein